MKSAAAAKPLPAQDQKVQAQPKQNVFVEERTPVPPLSPPIIHRGKLSYSQAIDQDDAHPRLCMIPKKRYSFLNSQSARLHQGQDVLPQYPYQQPSSASYTESDVSVAMILANGFGRSTSKKSAPNAEV